MRSQCLLRMYIGLIVLLDNSLEAAQYKLTSAPSGTISGQTRPSKVVRAKRSDTRRDVKRILASDFIALPNLKNEQKTFYSQAILVEESLAELCEHVLDELDYENMLGNYGQNCCLKGMNLGDFFLNLKKKLGGNKLATVGDITDAVRARLNFDSSAQAAIAFQKAAVLAQSYGFDVLAMKMPRRALTLPSGDLGYGYPRYHLNLQDPESKIRCELQFGSLAYNDCTETNAIPILSQNARRAIDSLGLTNNFHDIDYKLFQVLLNEQQADNILPKKLKTRLLNFATQLDEFSAEIGQKGYDVVDYHLRVGRFYRYAGTLIDEIFHEPHAKQVLHFFHGRSLTKNVRDHECLETSI